MKTVCGTSDIGRRLDDFHVEATPCIHAYGHLGEHLFKGKPYPFLLVRYDSPYYRLKTDEDKTKWLNSQMGMNE